MKAARIFIGLFVVIAAALGLLTIFEIIDGAAAKNYAAVMLGGLAVLAVATAVLGAMGGSKDPEPPPRL